MKYKICGVIANQPNVNGHIYDIKHIKEMINIINNEEVLIELNPKELSYDIDLTQVCAKAIKGSAQIIKDQLVYNIESLDTPAGNIFDSSELSVGSLIEGELDKNKHVKVNKIVKFHTITYDSGHTREEID